MFVSKTQLCSFHNGVCEEVFSRVVCLLLLKTSSVLMILAQFYFCTIYRQVGSSLNPAVLCTQSTFCTGSKANNCYVAFVWRDACIKYNVCCSKIRFDRLSYNGAQLEVIYTIAICDHVTLDFARTSTILTSCRVIWIYVSRVSIAQWDQCYRIW